SLLCMRMLAELPEDRLPVAPLCAALSETLSNAENDAAWDLPLIEPDDPQLTTTVDDPERWEPNETRRTFLKLTKQRPRRGRPLPDKAPALFLPAQVAGASPPAAAVDPDRISMAEAPQAAPPPREHEPPVMAPPLPAAREQIDPPAAPHSRPLVWRLGLVAAVLAMTAAVLSLGADLWGPGSASSTSTAQSELPLPSTFPDPGSTDGGVRGREVARDPKPLESLPGGDAAPDGAQPSASNANAMPRTPAQTPKNETPRPQPKSSGFTLPAVVAACSLLDGGCTASTPQVRPEPPAITCPQGWRDTHERFNVGFEGIATVKGSKGEPEEMARVKDGPASLQVGVYGRVGGLPAGTLLLGTWQLGDDRLFGTFTEAKIPGMGTVPVCLVTSLDADTAFLDERGKEYLCPPGLGTCLAPGSKPGNAKINTRVPLVRPAGQP
ncbi:hypothetical protein DAT35_52055, partial [Vitiosangium sp. GDMCC 1.1324]